MWDVRSSYMVLTWYDHVEPTVRYMVCTWFLHGLGQGTRSLDGVLQQFDLVHTYRPCRKSTWSVHGPNMLLHTM
jgi:hypothetical protein